MLEKIIENWFQILPTLVGLVALLVYYLQEGQKRKEAASLIILQINELTERIREISGYITEGGIDSVSFYESVPILENNYWNNTNIILSIAWTAIALQLLTNFIVMLWKYKNNKCLLKSYRKKVFY